MTSPTTDVVVVSFTDGTRVRVPAELASRVVGLDTDRHLLVPLFDEQPDFPAPDGSGPYLVPLTPCCQASGKGSETGIVCRRCYRPVDAKHGAWSRLAVPVVAEPRWSPRYERWRHGGWYVTNVRYPTGAVGCVSRNYPDRKWRIVCGPQHITFSSRNDAAHAEKLLADSHAAAAATATAAAAAFATWLRTELCVIGEDVDLHALHRQWVQATTFPLT